MTPLIATITDIIRAVPLIILAAVWLWMLIDCARNEKGEGGGSRKFVWQRVAWMIVIFFTFAFGAFAYLLFRKLPRDGRAVSDVPSSGFSAVALDASILMLVLLLALPPVAKQYTIFSNTPNGMVKAPGGDELVISSGRFGGGGQFVGWLWGVELGVWIPLTGAAFLISRGRKFDADVVLPWVIGIDVVSLFIPVSRITPAESGPQSETFLAISRIGRGEIPLLTHWVWVLAILIGVGCGFARGGKLAAEPSTTQPVRV